MCGPKQMKHLKSVAAAAIMIAAATYIYFLVMNGRLKLPRKKKGIKRSTEKMLIQ
jgi:hypothetical protein